MNLENQQNSMQPNNDNHSRLKNVGLQKVTEQFG